MKDLQNKVEALRSYIDKINEMAKELEGESCHVKFHINEPYNKIDFVTVIKETKF